MYKLTHYNGANDAFVVIDGEYIREFSSVEAARNAITQADSIGVTYTATKKTLLHDPEPAVVQLLEIVEAPKRFSV